MSRPKTPLTVICEWPADPNDITLEHAMKLCETGDVRGVLSDMVRLTSQLPSQRITPQEAKADARQSA